MAAALVLLLAIQLASATSLEFEEVFPALGFEPGQIRAGDVDGDGDMDLVVAGNPQGGAAVALNNGDGTFAAPWIGPTVSWQGGVVGFVFPFAMGDVNADGRDDVAMIRRNEVKVFLGQADGTLSGPQTFSVSPGGGASPYPGDVTIADLDGNGNGDLVIAISQQDGGSFLVPGTTVSVLLSDGDGTFSGPTEFAANTTPTRVEVADFDEDLHPDVVVTNNSSTSDPNLVSVLFGNGDGTMSAPIATAMSGANSLFNMAVADLDGDSHQDVVAFEDVGSDAMAHVLFGNGDGSFELLPRFIAKPGGLGSTRNTVATGDFNGDGLGDLVVPGLRVHMQKSGPYQFSDDFYDPQNPTSLLGNGLFGLREFYPDPDPFFSSGRFQIVTADFDDDGWDDIAHIGDKSFTNRLTVLLNRTASLPDVNLASLTLLNNTMEGDETNSGTVTLDSPAPPGGAIIEVFSTSSCVINLGGQVGCQDDPLQVTVPGGETSADFDFDVSSPAELPKTATIIAQYRETTMTAPITIVAEPGANQPPTASFTFNCTELTCDFDGSGSNDPDGSIVLYEWTFGDSATGNGEMVTHSYQESGSFFVVLTVTDDQGAEDNVGQLVEVDDGSGGGGEITSLSGSSINNGSTWTAVVTATGTAGGITSGTWDHDGSQGGCEIQPEETSCTFQLSGIRKKVSSITYTDSFDPTLTVTVSKP